MLSRVKTFLQQSPLFLQQKKTIVHSALTFYQQNCQRGFVSRQQQKPFEVSFKLIFPETEKNKVFPLYSKVTAPFAVFLSKENGLFFTERKREERRVLQSQIKMANETPLVSPKKLPLFFSHQKEKKRDFPSV
jgi:hypothetical protein